ncbi:site-specific integrase [Vibrio marisflavi]|uniref:Tyrosine recombinase XerC n=1 Tax=Vibrio marisflavi CECT 7928 TaxID=634439 RepID=A0ABN8E5U5_9VIBR|nr:site-specific integrase [Vibrio marisflavi]CAH0540915.1 Tyrosine recombinase XerC [Vibrio marisflavi CECT 7928]
MAIKQKITINSIKNFRVEDGRMNDTEVSGFHARISKNGLIKYYLYYRLKGIQCNYLLGSAKSLTPVQARDLAKEAAGLVASGKDVQLLKKESKRHTMRENLKLRTFLEKDYLPYLNGLNPKTAYKAYRNIISSFAFLLDKNIADINAWEIQKWVAERRKLGRATSTINYSLGRLKAALNRAVEWDVIDSHNLDKIKVTREDNTRTRYLSNQEEAALFQAIKDRDQRIRDNRISGNKHRSARRQYPSFDGLRFVDYIEPLILTAMHTGVRKGELLSLTWNDVWFEQRYLTVRAENAKSKKRRTIPLNDTILDVLTTWRSQNPEAEHVFISQNIPLTDVKKPWLRLMKESGIENFRFHDLRHHFASKLVMAGVDLNTVRELLGHSDLKMTLRYAHLAPEHKAAAVSMIG